MAAALTAEFWRGRRVFITGHTGFKGSWLTALLHRLGAKVTGYALDPPTDPSLFNVGRIGDLAESSIADIRDLARLTHDMQAAQPDVALHLAAQSLVRRAYAEPVETFSSNILGTVHFLEAVRHTPSVTAAVVVTSDKVYDNAEWPWAYRESDRLGGKEPYGASKAACEIVVEAYRRSFFSNGTRRVAVATARAGNVIGGGDWAEDRLIPDAMRAFSRGAPLIVRNPAAVRPWQHVLEPLAGYCRLAEALVEHEDLPEDMAFNFGPEAGDAQPVATVVEQIVTRWGSGAHWQQANGVAPYEARLLEVDSARARSCLGWQPRWRLADGLDRTVDWYRGHYAGRDAQALTFHQIDEYLHG